MPYIEYKEPEKLHALQSFKNRFPHLDIEQLIEHYAVFGGLAEQTVLRFSDSLQDSIRVNVLERLPMLQAKVLPSAFERPEFKRLLLALAHSDGKPINIFRRAAYSREKGMALLLQLQQAGILKQEASREAPFTGPKRKKSQRRYRIQPKIYFTDPFHRFWFTFVVPNLATLRKGGTQPFWNDFDRRFDAYVSQFFELLSNRLLAAHFRTDDPLIEHGHYWDSRNEFDLLAVTRHGRLIIGECKWKRQRVCKNQIGKLVAKCRQSSLHPNYLALFSKSGFSNELLKNRNGNVLCFTLEDFEKQVL